MKPIARYWDQHRETVTFRDGVQWDMTITGSSLTSASDAQRDARQRLARFVAFANTHERTGPPPEDWYYPDRRLPEQVLQEIHGPDGGLIAVVTRNRYGAEVLNTDALLITDIDLPTPSTPGAPRAGLLRRVLGLPVSATSPEFKAHVLQEQSRITGLIKDFAQRNPSLGVHTYQTRGGFRVLVTGTGARPGSDQAAGIMAELSSDHLYMRLCRVQETYRARLTPKPWRIGLPRNGSGDPRVTGSPEFRQWYRTYTEASTQHAVCRVVDRAGTQPSPEEQMIITLHDRATKPTSDLPLA